jgi:hypothetical protein
MEGGPVWLEMKPYYMQMPYNQLVNACEWVMLQTSPRIGPTRRGILVEGPLVGTSWNGHKKCSY